MVKQVHSALFIKPECECCMVENAQRQLQFPLWKKVQVSWAPFHLCQGSVEVSDVANASKLGHFSPVFKNDLCDLSPLVSTRSFRHILTWLLLSVFGNLEPEMIFLSKTAPMLVSQASHVFYKILILVLNRMFQNRFTVPSGKCLSFNCITA